MKSLKICFIGSMSSGISGFTGIGANMGSSAGATAGSNSSGGSKGGGGMMSMIDGAFKSVFGIGQLISGAIKEKKAKALMPQEVDPTQTNMLEVFRQLRKNYQTGSEASSYKDVINQGLAGAENKAAAYAGGNTGALLNAMSNTQANANQALNTTVASLEKNRLGALAMEDQQTDDIAQRKLDIRMMKYLQKKGEATSEKKAGQQNWLAGHEEFGQGAGDVWGGGMGKMG